MDLLLIIAGLEAKAVGLRVLDFGGSPIDTKSPTAKMLVTMFGAVGEFEWTCYGLALVTCLSLCHLGFECEQAYAPSAALSNDALHRRNLGLLRPDMSGVFGRCRTR
jgi:hypothetical protein